MSELLSYSELCQVTGAKRHSKQRQVLETSGVCFIVRLDGSLSVTWTAINSANNHPQTTQSDDGFDLGAI